MALDAPPPPDPKGRVASLIDRIDQIQDDLIELDDDFGDGDHFDYTRLHALAAALRSGLDRRWKELQG